MEEKEPSEINQKEERIRNIALMYYSRQDIRKAIFQFSQNREIVPRYFEGFGKRPDSLQYDSDILSFIQKGATSFHCSEEIWKDVLALSTDLNEEQLNELREGWDLLIDIDCKYIEYSKKAAQALIKSMEFHGVKNIGVKFSVSGDTDILIKNRGIINLLSISNAVELLKKGHKLEVFSLDKNKKLKFSKIYDYLEHEDRLYEIFHSQSKIPLKTTGHHSVFVWKNGDIIEKKVTELKKGDFLVSFNSKINPLVKENKEIINEFEFSKNQFSKKIIKRKILLTSELMRLIGYFLAEGHTTKIINQVGFSFNINEKEYIEDCQKLLFKITKRKISIRHPNPNSTQILIHSKEWHDFFKNNCGEKKGKHFPDFSWNLSREFFLEMLRGYLRGDGYKIGEYTIVAKSVSKRLIKELIWLCKLNNISCSLSSEQNKPHKLPQGNYFKGSFVYIIKIPKSELLLTEFNRLRNKFSPYPQDKIFPIDGLKKIYFQIKPKMFNNHRAEQMTLKKKCANFNRIKKVLEWFSKYGSIKKDEESKRIIKSYKGLSNSDISVVEVRNIIKKGKEKVYDVSVEETESFFGNDYPVLLHNSGSKGFHIIVPWKAFPKEIYGQKTKEMFPGWPRMVCSYLTEVARPILEREMEQEDIKFTSQLEKGMMCLQCKNISEEIVRKTLHCPRCKREETSEVQANSEDKIRKCPDCRIEMLEKERKVFYKCLKCNMNSAQNPDNFRSSIDFFKVLGVDVVLVSPRHLFRAPYSLHEKTSLSSVVINKDEVSNFKIQDANPLRVQVKDFYPEAEEEEARELLLQAIDWSRSKKQEAEEQKNKKQEGKQGDFKEIIIKNLSSNLYPPCITLILKGLKQDGRKRALFILINFFKSLKMSNEDLEKEIEKWNKNNYKPLKQGYIQSQLSWHSRNKAILPPNCDKPHYKELGVCKPDNLCRLVKNPVNYAVRKSFMLNKQNKKHSIKSNNKNRK